MVKRFVRRLFAYVVSLATTTPSSIARRYQHRRLVNRLERGMRDYGRSVNGIRTSDPRRRARLALAASGRSSNGKGWDGVPRSGGKLDWEHNPDLKDAAWTGDSQTVGVGLKMCREDPEAKRIVKEYVSPLLSAPWDMEPSDPDDPIALKVAGYCEDVLLGPGWQDRLRDHILMIRDGFRLSEYWFEWRPDMVVREYEKPTDEETGIEARQWRRTITGTAGAFVPVIEPRLPNSVEEWIWDADGNLKEVLQTTVDNDSGRMNQPHIPVEDLLIFTNEREGGNVAGEALLRPCYGYYQLRRDLVIDFGIGSQRWGVGTPVVKETVPNTLTTADWNRLETVAREYGIDANQYLLSIYGSEFSILEAEMKTGDVLVKFFDLAGREMHRAAGTEHVYSGEGYGAKSHIETKTATFLQNAQHIGLQIAEVYTASLLPKLLTANGWDLKYLPRMVCGELSEPDAKATAEAYGIGVAGKLITPQLEDEERYRADHGWPALSPDALQKRLSSGAVVGLGGDEPAQNTALNGAQVASAKGIVADVVAGVLSEEMALAMLMNFFGLSEDVAQSMLAGVDKLKAPKTDTPPPPTDESDDDDDPPAPDGLSMHRTDCACGQHALARPFQAIPHEVAIQHAEALGPFAALAEKHFGADASRSARQDALGRTVRGVEGLIQDIATDYATALDGKTLREAATIKAPGRARLKAYLRRQLTGVDEMARSEVTNEAKRQKRDPEYAAEFVEAFAVMGQRGELVAGDMGFDSMAEAVAEDPFGFARAFGPGTSIALATIGQKAKGKKGRPTNRIDQLDFNDYLDGVAGTSAWDINNEIERLGHAAVQDGKGAATAKDIKSSIAAGWPTSKVTAQVQPDVNGVYATGRALQQRVEGMEWGWYTTTPELSSQVCEVCEDTEARADNGFRIGGTLEDTFPVPNPGCLGNQGGSNRCWCVILGMLAPPEGDRVGFE